MLYQTNAQFDHLDKRQAVGLRQNIAPTAPVPGLSGLVCGHLNSWGCRKEVFTDQCVHTLMSHTEEREIMVVCFVINFYLLDYLLPKSSPVP